MAKSDFEVAVAFATQDGEGEASYDATLDGITTVLTAANGLVLGDADAGVRGSGFDLTLGRRKKDKAFVGASFTRSLSDFLAAEVRTFTFAMPFCGNRGDATNPIEDADGIPITGLDALLEGMGMQGTAWAGGDIGHRYVFASQYPISALVYYFGNRLELADCRVAGSILFEPQSIPILTANIEVGSIKDHSLAALPGTLTYGEQQTISAPVVEGVALVWKVEDDPRAGGFSTLTLNITPSFATIGDSNAATGAVKEMEDREVSIEGTIFEDDATDAGHVYEQLTASAIATLDPIDFLVGTAMVADTPVKAVGITMPDPEPDEVTIAALGTKAGHDVKLLGRGATANTELEIIFQ